MDGPLYIWHSMLLGPFFIRTRKLIWKLNERFGDISFFTSQDQITMSGLKTNKRENQYTRLLGSRKSSTADLSSWEGNRNGPYKLLAYLYLKSSSKRGTRTMERRENFWTPRTYFKWLTGSSFALRSGFLFLWPNSYSIKVHTSI